MSLAGLPPLAGFLGKLLLFVYFLFKSYYLIGIILVLNMFMMFFYLQNLRFLVKKHNYINNTSKTYLPYFNFNSIIYLIILNFLNIFSIFIFEDFILFFYTILLYI